MAAEGGAATGVPSSAAVAARLAMWPPSNDPSIHSYAAALQRLAAAGIPTAGTLLDFGCSFIRDGQATRGSAALYVRESTDYLYRAVAASRGRGNCVVVTGSRGLGKTALRNYVAVRWFHELRESHTARMVLFSSTTSNEMVIFMLDERGCVTGPRLVEYGRNAAALAMVPRRV